MKSTILYAAFGTFLSTSTAFYVPQHQLQQRQQPQRPQQRQQEQQIPKQEEQRQCFGCRRSLSVVEMAKNSDRAHIERTLEDMMDNDWRVFRAKLVAQEQAEGQPCFYRAGSNEDDDNSDFSNNNNKNKKKNRKGSSVGEHDKYDDHKLNKQNQLGELFSGVMSSIFKSNHHSANQGGKKTRKQQKQKTAASASAASATKAISSREDIFEGATIGRALDNEEEWLVHDPFISQDELPIHLQPKSVSIDKHRWAHPIPHVEPGSVLIANEKLGGVFHQTIVLIIEHHEALGSTGIVINRPMEGNLLKIASEHKDHSKLDLSLKLAFHSAPVTYGGPVLSDEYSILHGFGEVDGSRKLCPGVFVGGSDELMDEVRLNRFDPQEALFVKGHAAWVPGQLSREISKGVWYTAAVSSDFILRYAGHNKEHASSSNDLWVDILTCMGGEYADIAMMHAGRGDRRMMP